MCVCDEGVCVCVMRGCVCVFVMIVCVCVCDEGVGVCDEGVCVCHEGVCVFVFVMRVMGVCVCATARRVTSNFCGQHSIKSLTQLTKMILQQYSKEAII